MRGVLTALAYLLSPLLALFIAVVMVGAGLAVAEFGADPVRLVVYPAILVGVSLSLAAYLRLAKASSSDGRISILLLFSIYTEGAWVGLLTILVVLVTRRIFGYEQVIPDAVLYSFVAGAAATILIRGVVLIVGALVSPEALQHRVPSVFFRKRPK